MVRKIVRGKVKKEGRERREGEKEGKTRRRGVVELSVLCGRQVRDVSIDGSPPVRPRYVSE
jgi:hypothetical protein